MRGRLWFLIGLVSVWMLISAPVSAEQRLYTSGKMDGYALRDWWTNPNYYNVNTDGETIDVYHDGGSRWLTRGIVIFDIRSLAGKTLQPGSATLNFYSNGFNGCDLQHFDYDPGPEVLTGYAQAGGPSVGALTGNTGWQVVDVTAFLQSAINRGQQYDGYIFAATVNYGGGSLFASEDRLGRGAFISVVPEPASLTALLCGLSGVLALRRRRR